MTRPNQQAAELEALIRQCADRGEASLASLLPLVYDELRALAARQLSRQRPDHTLQPTALINEAYLRLAGQDYENWQSRREFVLIAATVMRHVLVDYARQRTAQKRPQAKQQLDIDDIDPGQAFGSELIAIDEVLEQLGAIDERQARIVELRYFAGLSMEETANTLEVSRSTVAREWRMARAWLKRRLSEE
ncbi:sigma-70 family RNA polymerase sigma factor [Wenzhouxiangella sp. XN201]|uniref:ECF-type sigma factor n=1 Tax=Wenzhouxiangella sp. XN201 TaxID=2710755 RepID=UPI0013C79A16|nr:ECF-type sigma factor [Wenzhouxiangella sp. XN201]NEZ03629.1 sigma-70 family RNA polymerase sigma factor [Wenzhouxiangella sp. XN201]